MSQTLTKVPVSFRAGDTLKFHRSFCDDSPTEWTLTYYLSGPQSINFAATNDSGQFLVNVAASTTVNWSEGVFAWQAVVSKGAEKFTVETGELTILPNLAAAVGNVDRRIWAQRALAIVEAYLEGRLAKGLLSYQIGGRSITRYSYKEAFELRRELITIINSHNRRNSGADRLRLVPFITDSL